MINLLRRIFFGSQLSKKKKKGTRLVKKGIANEKEWATFQSIFFFQTPLATGAVKVSFILFRKIVNWDPSLALEGRMRDLVMFN